MEKAERFFAVIPAAGQGTRMGETGKNKQFLELSGIPILLRTLLVFERSPRIDGIVVAASPSEKEAVRTLCEGYPIAKLIGVPAGGKTRQDSVRNALLFLRDFLGRANPADANTVEEAEADGSDYVLIHDGARPFITGEILDRCIDGVRKHRACGAGVMVKDTIKQVRADGTIFCTPPRDELWAIQTPQAFALSLIARLHQRARADGLLFTDDTAIAEYYGEEVHMVAGDYRNIKITTPEDLLYGELLLQKDLSTGRSPNPPTISG